MSIRFGGSLTTPCPTRISTSSQMQMPLFHGNITRLAFNSWMTQDRPPDRSSVGELPHRPTQDGKTIFKGRSAGLLEHLR